MAQNWDTYNENWDQSQMNWDDINFLLEIAQMFVGPGYEDYLLSRKPEVKKRLIKILAKVDGEKYLNETVKKQNIKVIVRDVQLLVESLTGIKIKVHV